MITKLCVKNYLSLHDVELELRPRTNVFVGPNMSGKSNLLDCLKFLNHMVSQGLTKALLDRGGFAEVVWKGSDENRLSLELHAEGGEPQKVYAYKLVIVGSATGLISVEREQLTIQTTQQTYSLIDLNHGHGQITHADGTTAFASPGPGHSALEFAVPGWEGMDVRSFMAAWHFYRLVPTLMRQINVAAGQNFLSENGDNFSSWLMTIQTSYPEEFHRVQQAASDVFPDLESLLTPVSQFVTTVTSREKFLKRPVTLQRMSDGELSFLAWLSLIYAPLNLAAPLYCIEELENHLHPRLLETLIELLRQRQEELGLQAAQIIMTTHSPYLVDHLALEELIVTNKHKGATSYTRPASKSHLRELLERGELGLGELWYAGALGSQAC